MWRSVRFRLLLSTILVLLLAVGVTAFMASRRTTGEFQRYVAIGGSARNGRLATALGRSYRANDGWGNVQPAVEQLAQISGHRMVVSDAHGQVVADSERNLVGKSVSSNWPRPAANVMVEGQRVGSLYIDPVTGPDQADLDFLSAVNRSLLVGAGIAGLAAVVLTMAISGRILRPVGQLTAAAQRMEKGDLTVRVPIDSEDEIGQLAHAFNAMAGSLAQQEQLRRNMVGDVAHELRTPLTNLRGYLQAAKDGLVAPDLALVDNLYEETMLLNRLVNDLQELAQAEAGQLRLELQPIALASAIDQAVGMLRPQADAKGLRVEATVPPDLPLVNADPQRLGQILRNLLNNSVAHTPQGGTITVSASADQQTVAVSVRDTGSGISAEHLPYVFDRFYRADRSRARQTGGAGLGLAIVKQLVIAMGGSISVQSEVGRGTTFTLTLPVAAAVPNA